MTRASFLHRSPLLLLAAALVALAVLFAPGAQPAQAQTTTVWSATLTAATLAGTTATGCNAGAGTSGCATSLTDNDFTYGGANYVVKALIRSPSNNDLSLVLDKAIPESLKGLTLNVGSQTFSLGNAAITSSVLTDDTATWTNPGFSWSAGDTVQLSLTERTDNADLRALTASGNERATGTFTSFSLTPAFAPGTTAYTATVPNTITHVRLTPTVADSDSTVEVGKSGSLATVTSGRASRAIALDVGANAIQVKVTAEDTTTTKTYTVTVTRHEPPTVSLSASPNPVTPVDGPADDAPDLKRANVVITATLSTPLSEDVWIPVTLDQEQDPDHGVISSIAIKANELTGGHTIIVLEDWDTVDDTFTVSLDTDRLPSPVEAGTPASVTVTITDSDDKAAPGAPGSFTVTPKVLYLLVTWNRPTGRITHYEAQFKTTAAPNQAATTAGDPTTGWITMPKWTALKTLDAETGSTEDNTSGRITLLPDGLDPDTAYNVRVRAVNWTANGSWATGQGTPTRAGGL